MKFSDTKNKGMLIRLQGWQLYYNNISEDQNHTYILKLFPTLVLISPFIKNNSAR
jgi:hypothetical protein